MSSGALTIVSDTFTRADNALSLGTTEVGAKAWTAHDGVWGISSNKAFLSTTDPSKNGATVDAGVSDCSVSVDVVAVAAGGVMVRAIDDSDRIEVAIIDAATVRAAKRVAGAFTSLGTAAHTFASGDTLKVTMSGANFSVFVNGVLLFTFTESAGQTRTRHGLEIEGGTDPSIRLDNFSVTVP